VSFRFLQLLITAVLLVVMLVIGGIGFQHSRNTVDYLTLVVDLHTPVLTSFSKINRSLVETDKNILAYQNQLEISSVDFSLMMRRYESEINLIAAISPENIQQLKLTAVNNAINVLVKDFEDGNAGRNVEADIESLEMAMLRHTRVLSRIYKRAGNSEKQKLAEHIEIISNLNTSIKFLLERYAQQKFVSYESVIEPLKSVEREADYIERVLKESEINHATHEHEILQDEHNAVRAENTGFEVREELESLLVDIRKLGQAINIYAQEKVSMDSSASQVRDTLDIVNRLNKSIKNHVQKSNRLYQEHVRDDQLKLLRYTEQRQKLFVVFLLVGLLLAVLSVVFVNRLVGRDLKKMEVGAAVFSEGDFSYRMSGLRLEEFNNLSEEYNEMAKRIGEKDEMLRNYVKEVDQAHLDLIVAKHGLEQEVEIRTKDLRKAVEDAEKSDKAKSAFLANMSHELRTPLHGILSFASFGMKKSATASEDKIKKYFTLINDSGSRLKVLLDDLLDLSKLEAGKMQLNKCPVNLFEVFKSCVAEQEAVLKTHNIKTEYRVVSALPNVSCDKNRIGQVLMNVLSNAIKFSPDNSQITFAAEIKSIINDHGDSIAVIEVCIQDQGKGVPENETKTIFKKFVQSESNEYKSGGTGLGLAISKELVQAHGGEIWCENAEKGGAIFSFYLPVSEAEDMAS